MDVRACRDLCVHWQPRHDVTLLSGTVPWQEQALAAKWPASRSSARRTSPPLPFLTTFRFELGSEGAPAKAEGGLALSS